MVPYEILNGNCIRFNRTFNGPLDPYYPIINRYTILRFDNCAHNCDGFNHHVILTKQLVELYFNDSFNKPIRLAKRLSRVDFGNSFDQPLDLSKNLFRIDFGEFFDQPVILPKHLKILSFGGRFDNKIILPNNIKRLAWGVYKQSVVFERQIDFLYVCCDVNMYLIDHLPNSVQELVYEDCDKQKQLSHNLPNDVKCFMSAW